MVKVWSSACRTSQIQSPTPSSVLDSQKKCCGEIWASSTGQSFTGLSQIVVDDTTGLGKIVSTVPKGGFTAGSIEIHHKMDGFFCEILADGAGFLNGAISAVVTAGLQVAFPLIIAEVVEKPG